MAAPYYKTEHKIKQILVISPEKKNSTRYKKIRDVMQKMFLKSYVWNIMWF